MKVIIRRGGMPKHPGRENVCRDKMRINEYVRFRGFPKCETGVGILVMTNLRL